MARIRTIKPMFFLNEDVAALPYEWRLLFVGLWTQADREGRLEDRPARLKASLFPYDDLDINDGLSRLDAAGLITRYEGDGHKLIAIPNWAKHQLANNREPVSELQPPLSLLIPTLVEGKGREGIGKGKDLSSLRSDFDRFWAVYPRKVGKDGALKVWDRLGPDGALTDVLIAAVRFQLKNWTDPQFIPHAKTWLNGKRWQDEVESAANRQTMEAWSCPHVLRCERRSMCDVASRLGRPEHVKAEAS